jgi:hypothetical protein
MEFQRITANSLSKILFILIDYALVVIVFIQRKRERRLEQGLFNRLDAGCARTLGLSPVGRAHLFVPDIPR